jgi:hypothetical protein
VAAPVPIPNTAVKRLSAYDTSSQDAGKSVAARSANRIITNLFLHNTKRPARRNPAGRSRVRKWVAQNADSPPWSLIRRKGGAGEGHVVAGQSARTRRLSPSPKGSRRRTRRGAPDAPAHGPAADLRRASPADGADAAEEAGAAGLPPHRASDGPARGQTDRVTVPVIQRSSAR